MLRFYDSKGELSPSQLSESELERWAYNIMVQPMLAIPTF